MLSSLSILNKVSSINADNLTSFILSAQVGVLRVNTHRTVPFYFDRSFQDPDGGGIADRPGNMVDVFHTHFGIAGISGSILYGWSVPYLILYVIQGLSILGYPNLIDLDPVYCMPATVIEAKGLRKAWKALERRQS